MTIRILGRIALATAFTAVAACGGDDDTGPAGADGEMGEMGEMGEPGEPGEPGVDGTCGATEIRIAGTSFFPEGIAQASDGTLYIGSVGTGEIVAYQECDIFPSAFADVGDMAAVGMTVDDANGVLWVCASSLTGVPPEIVGFDLADGAEVARHAFEDDAGFCNDLALDSDGNLYATDSFGARVMKIAASDLLDETVDAVEWLVDDALTAASFGANGIVFDSTDQVYVGNYEDGLILRAGMDANGNPVDPTVLNLIGALSGPDGIELIDDDTLLVVENFSDELSTVTLDGDDGAVELVANRLDEPTTAAIDGDSVWVVEGQLSDLMDETQPDLPFLVVRMPLP